MSEPIREIMARLWRFTRGETPTAEFERWVYATPELEPLLGPELYLRLIAATALAFARVRTLGQGV
ncbi:MAG TPA: hypothetical protein VJW73_03600 [Gemmatimonadaceae bacterium]|nr:hypothetical protein [Gemmatimonadaceae bacterium]